MNAHTRCIIAFISIYKTAHNCDVTVLQTSPDLNTVKCKGENVPAKNININATVRCLADEDPG